MFFGEFKHSLDDKGRLIVPSVFRDACRGNRSEGKGFFLTKGLDQCIFIFTEKGWEGLKQGQGQLEFTRRAQRQFQRLFYAQASHQIPDAQGRILVPASLKAHAQIVRDVMVVGVNSRFEVWEEKAWTAYQQQSEKEYEVLAEDLFGNL
jgi:MraZ protein